MPLTTAHVGKNAEEEALPPRIGSTISGPNCKQSVTAAAFR